jgi:intraflagellar transport protein 81
LDGKKDCVFDILFYLLGNLDICAKRAYLAPFLSAPNVPPEFLMDSDLSTLAQDLGQLQANFVQSHRMFEDLKAANEPIIELKKDLSKMEEEKQQVLIKIARMKKKVEDIPNNELWLEAARNLRLSKKNQADLAARLQEQIRIIEQDDAKIVALHEKMNTARVQNKGLTPQAALTRAGEELKTIRYLVQEKYPKVVVTF